jgi:hypothetical protein
MTHSGGGACANDVPARVGLVRLFSIDVIAERRCEPQGPSLIRNPYFWIARRIYGSEEAEFTTFTL